MLYFSFAVASAINLWNRFIFEDHEHEKFAPLIQNLFIGCVQKPGETFDQFLINLRQVCKDFVSLEMGVCDIDIATGRPATKSL